MSVVNESPTPETKQNHKRYRFPEEGDDLLNLTTPDPIQLLNDQMLRTQLLEIMPALKKPKFAFQRVIYSTSKRSKAVVITPVEHFADVPELNIRILQPYQLYPHQIEAVRWLQQMEDPVSPAEQWEPHRRGGLLAMSMGMGKTPIAACLILSSLPQQRAAKQITLYLCPKMIVMTVKAQFEKFAGSQIRVGVMSSDATKKPWKESTFFENPPFDVLIANYECVVSLLKARSPQSIALLAQVEFFRILIDESHELRERTTFKFQLINQMRSPRRICMSGSPIFNSFSDLYTQLMFCGLRMGEEKRWGRKQTEGLKNHPRIKVYNRQDIAEVKLPPKQEKRLYFDLNLRERHMHNLFLRKAQTDLPNGPKKSIHFSLYKAMAVCTGAHLLSTIGRAKYVKATDRTQDMVMEAEPSAEDKNEIVETTCQTCPPPPTDAFSVHEHDQMECWMGDPRSSAGFFGSKMMCFVNLCDHQMQQDPTRKMIIFGNYSSSLRFARDALFFHYPQHKDATRFLTGDVTSSSTRETILADFRHLPEIHFLFMTLKLGGTGLNLTEADTVIFLENWYCYSVLHQAQCRVHRIGQQRPVEVFYFVARDTVEERMINIAKDKKDMTESILGRPFQEKMDWTQVAQEPISK